MAPILPEKPSRHSDFVNGLAVVCGSTLVFALPYIHLGIISDLVYSARKPEVDVANCANTCWDTKFKGDYETIPAAYKHVYFNITHQTLKIWFTTVVFMIAFYETCKRLVHLCVKGKLRFSMFALFASVVYSHYYTWWAFFNSLNDDFYKQWYHQLYFSLTEMISTVCVVYLFNKDNPLYPKLLLLILDIAIFHILTASQDQFIKNIFLNRGEFFQKMRDMAFMLPDLMHVVVAGCCLYRWFRSRHKSLRSLVKQNDVQVHLDLSPDVITRLDLLLSVLLVFSLCGFVHVL